MIEVTGWIANITNDSRKIQCAIIFALLQSNYRPVCLFFWFVLDIEFE